MIKTIDSILNRFTMYRLIIYCLVVLLGVGFIFALAGKIGITAGGLVISILILLIAGYISNEYIAKLFKVPKNLEAGIITCLILACILPTPKTVAQGLYIALAAVIAMASKFLLTARRSPIFNPAAVAAAILSISGLYAATWWIGSPPMAAFTTIVGLIMLRKQRKFSLFIAFALASLSIFLLVTLLTGNQTVLPAIKTLFLSYPLIFMGTIMLTEPSTLPVGRYNHVLYGLLVGSVFTSQLHLGSHLSATPENALIVGNLFALAITYRFAATIKFKQHVSLADNLSGLHFDKPAALKFLPGQYLEWTLPYSFKNVDSRGNRRSFSIASSPTEDNLHIGVKYYEPSSVFKKQLSHLEAGQTIQVARPAGDFILPNDQNQPLIFIAGGIGITPFRSMIKYLVDTKQSRNITLFYSASTGGEFAYKDVFEAAKAVGVTTNYVVGRIDKDKVLETIKALSTPLIYISGPNALVQAYKSTLRQSGVPIKQIKTDYFSGY
jgi:ferredoxin-NADP reductase/Na+-transporting NADH:ubiquinone oxidoreductase subunit NqrB